MIEKQILDDSNKERFMQMKITVRKLFRDYKIPLSKNDYNIVDQFINDP